MKRKQLWILGGGLAVVLVGGLSVAGMKDKGIAVQVATVGRENLQAKVSANGKVQAVKKVDISANVMGQVTKLAVKEGDVVKAGAFLMEIDPARSRATADAQAAASEASAKDWESARARLQQARSDFARAEANRKAGIISQSDFEQLRTTLTTTEAAALASQRRYEQSKAGLRDA
ncbi:MAG: biotin/lipoyl-binding protein, partial [Geothrix sp.]|nr:biotin/lipoyl-binding protein [Geothrix sp.]